MSNHTRCSVCYLPVSMKEETADKRSANSEGGWDHKACLNPSRERQILDEIFGNGYAAERRRVAADELGGSLGHAIGFDQTARGAVWTCTCGERGVEPGYDKGRQRELGRAHLRDVYVNDTP